MTIEQPATAFPLVTFAIDHRQSLPTVPWQLPASTTIFVNRDALLALANAPPLVFDTVTAIQESESPLVVFLLEEGDGEELIFSDTSGLVYGIGQSFRDAVESWITAATDARRSLEGHELMRPKLREKFNLLTDVLR